MKLLGDNFKQTLNFFVLSLSFSLWTNVDLSQRQLHDLGARCLTKVFQHQLSTLWYTIKVICSAGLRHSTLSSRPQTCRSTSQYAVFTFSPFIPQTCRSTSLYAVFTFFAIHSSDLPVYVIVHCLHVFRHSFPRPIEDYNWSPPSRIMKMLCTWTK